MKTPTKIMTIISHKVSVEENAPVSNGVLAVRDL